MIPGSPTRDEPRPNNPAIFGRRVYRRQSIVARNVTHHRHQHRAEKIKQAAGEEIRTGGSLPWASDAPASRTQAAAAPRNGPRNNGLMTATLTDCIAAMPCVVGNRTNAFIANAEKAKKTPAINPQQSAEMSVNP